MVARRDGVDEAEARTRVTNTLRAVAAAREAEAAKAEPGDLVDPKRREHLTRAARARVWLDHHFAPSHRAEDIPDDDPLLEKAKTKTRYIHPELHVMCQLLAVPTEAETLEDFAKLSADPAWKAKAKTRFDRAAKRLRRYIQPSDPGACALMQKLIHFEVKEADGVTLRIEAKAMFLDACAKQAADGSCAEPRWIPDWVEQVRGIEPPGFGEAFYTRFGWHLVFLQQIRPERGLDNPDTARVPARADPPGVAARRLRGLHRAAQRTTSGAHRQRRRADAVSTTKTRLPRVREVEVHSLGTEFGQVLSQMVTTTPGALGAVLSRRARRRHRLCPRSGADQPGRRAAARGADRADPVQAGAAVRQARAARRLGVGRVRGRRASWRARCRRPT